VGVQRQWRDVKTSKKARTWQRRRSRSHVKGNVEINAQAVLDDGVHGQVLVRARHCERPNLGRRQRAAEQQRGQRQPAAARRRHLLFLHPSLGVQVKALE